MLRERGVEAEEIDLNKGLSVAELEKLIGKRDYRIVQGCVLAISTTYIVANSLTDMLYRWLDPRIRVS